MRIKPVQGGTATHDALPLLRISNVPPEAKAHHIREALVAVGIRGRVAFDSHQPTDDGSQVALVRLQYVPQHLSGGAPTCTQVNQPGNSQQHQLACRQPADALQAAMEKPACAVACAARVADSLMQARLQVLGQSVVCDAPRLNHTIFIGNLHPSVDDSVLVRDMSQFGQLDRWFIVKGKSGRSQGYGFVEFTLPSSAADAVAAAPAQYKAGTLAATAATSSKQLALATVELVPVAPQLPPVASETPSNALAVVSRTAVRPAIRHTAPATEVDIQPCGGAFIPTSCQQATAPAAVPAGSEHALALALVKPEPQEPQPEEPQPEEVPQEPQPEGLQPQEPQERQPQEPQSQEPEPEQPQPQELQPPAPDPDARALAVLEEQAEQLPVVFEFEFEFGVVGPGSLTGQPGSWGLYPVHSSRQPLAAAKPEPVTPQLAAPGPDVEQPVQLDMGTQLAASDMDQPLQLDMGTQQCECEQGDACAAHHDEVHIKPEPDCMEPSSSLVMAHQELPQVKPEPDDSPMADVVEAGVDGEDDHDQQQPGASDTEHAAAADLLQAVAAHDDVDDQQQSDEAADEMQGVEQQQQLQWDHISGLPDLEQLRQDVPYLELAFTSTAASCRSSRLLINNLNNVEGLEAHLRHVLGPCGLTSLQLLHTPAADVIRAVVELESTQQAEDALYLVNGLGQHEVLGCPWAMIMNPAFVEQSSQVVLSHQEEAGGAAETSTQQTQLSEPQQEQEQQQPQEPSGSPGQHRRPPYTSSRRGDLQELLQRHWQPMQHWPPVQPAPQPQQNWQQESWQQVLQRHLHPIASGLLEQLAELMQEGHKAGGTTHAGTPAPVASQGNSSASAPKAPPADPALAAATNTMYKPVVRAGDALKHHFAPSAQQPPWPGGTMPATAPAPATAQHSPQAGPGTPPNAAAQPAVSHSTHHGPSLSATAAAQDRSSGPEGSTTASDASGDHPVSSGAACWSPGDDDDTEDAPGPGAIVVYQSTSDAQQHASQPALPKRLSIPVLKRLQEEQLQREALQPGGHHRHGSRYSGKKRKTARASEAGGYMQHQPQHSSGSVAQSAVSGVRHNARISGCNELCAHPGSLSHLYQAAAPMTSHVPNPAAPLTTPPVCHARTGHHFMTHAHPGHRAAGPALRPIHSADGERLMPYPAQHWAGGYTAPVGAARPAYPPREPTHVQGMSNSQGSWQHQQHHQQGSLQHHQQGSLQHHQQGSWQQQQQGSLQKHQHYHYQQHHHHQHPYQLQDMPQSAMPPQARLARFMAKVDGSAPPPAYMTPRPYQGL